MNIILKQLKLFLGEIISVISIYVPCKSGFTSNCTIVTNSYKKNNNNVNCYDVYIWTNLKCLRGLN